MVDFERVDGRIRSYFQKASRSNSFRHLAPATPGEAVGLAQGILTLRPSKPVQAVAGQAMKESGATHSGPQHMTRWRTSHYS